MAFSVSSKQFALSCWLLISLLLSAPIAQATTYELNPGQSEIVIRVYRGGAFKALGHNHIVSTHDVTGAINWDKKNIQKTDFKLLIPLESFRVDDPELRKQAGKAFSKDVDDSARNGTRKNMLGEKVLDVSRFPKINVRSNSIKQNNTSELDVAIELRIHGINRIVTVPVVFEQNAESIRVKGKFSLLQSDYGIKPLRAAFGSIVVKDRVDIRFLLVARKVAR